MGDSKGTSEVAVEVNVKLRQGSKVDFLIGPNPSIGVVQFTAKIESRDD